MVDLNSSVGYVETQYYSFAHPPKELVLENGEKLGPITVAFETYGKLDARKSNAILILHAFSGDAHAAGYHRGEDKPGWWETLIGPGKAFDTDKYYVICSNVIGGCKGSTGPSSLDPKTKKPYGLSFPMISVRDMVTVQRHLIDHLGIEKLLSVAGGSMGGMQVLQWLLAFPERIRSAIPIATAAKHSPQQIAFNEVGRQAIMADPHWKEGSYYLEALPAKGLTVARMVGTITYMSDQSMTDKFGRRLKNNGEAFKFTPDFEVEGYLHHQGNSFVGRFDANSYLYITKAMDYFNASANNIQWKNVKDTGIRVLAIAFKSDWLYPAYQSREIAKACKSAGLETTYCEVDSTYGHDAFLLEIAEESHLIRHFLENLFTEKTAVEYEI